MKSQLSTLLKSPGPSDAPTAELESPSQGPRSGSLSTVASRDWRRRLAGWVPWFLLLGFFALLALTFGPRLLPARPLAVVSVVTLQQSADEAAAVAEARAEASSRPDDPTASPSPPLADAGDSPIDFDAPMQFQASGWIEPDPYPVKATALVDGVVASVEVLEGEKVSRGQVLARLIDDDARLDLETARAKLASLEALAEAHHHQIAAAEAEISSLAKQIRAAATRLEKAADIASRLGGAGSGSVSGQDIAQAELERAVKQAELDALAATEVELRANVERHTEMHADFAARIAEARTEIDRRQLALDRTRIESPIDGRILALHAVPGKKKMLRMDDPDSATIAILYDPESLQARIDVPLAEAAQLSVGQPVRIRSSLLPDVVFHGRVTRILGEADLQRNTLQAKVAIENPDPRLRPEMLCRAEFLAHPDGAAPPGESDSTGTARRSAADTRVRVFVPLAAVVSPPAEGAAAEPTATVWKVDASGERVTTQPITLGAEQRDNHRLVIDGLLPGDRVVLDPPADLEEGERFRNTRTDFSATPGS